MSRQEFSLTVNTGGEEGQILDHLLCARDPHVRHRDAKDLLKLVGNLRSRIAELEAERDRLREALAAAERERDEVRQALKVITLIHGRATISAELAAKVRDVVLVVERDGDDYLYSLGEVKP